MSTTDQKKTRDGVPVVTSTEARASWSDILSRAEYAAERTVVERNGKIVAAIVPLEQLQALERLEDEYDVRMAEEASREYRETGERRPWSEVKAELHSGDDDPTVAAEAA
jgi:antitoxin (DNA-binding transcriptional repressor) of toxin-antitoxin stability system